MDKHYDLIVIGAGSAGSAVAKRAARDDRKVALVERYKLGGTCLNAGCDPTKALLHIAEQLHDMRNAVRYGLKADGIRFDWSEVRAYIDGKISDIRGGSHEDAVAKQESRGIEVYLEEGRFVSETELRVGEKCISADRFLIATGYVERMPEIEGLTRDDVLTSWDAVQLDQLPQRLVVIGGGAQGCEFAQLFQRFGVDVTILQKGPRLLMKDDEELSARLKTHLEEEGITIHCNAPVQRAEKTQGSWRLYWGEDSNEATVTVDAILIAAGKKPAVEGLGLDAAGIRYENGIRTTDSFQTDVPHIWAVGDVLGGYAFTHVASTHAKMVYENMFHGGEARFSPDWVPWVTYTDPALAHVGATASQLRDRDVDFQELSLDLEDVVRAKLTGQTAGKVKILADQEGRILGGHVLARHAGDLIAPVILAMKHGIRVDEISDTMLPYPTRAEAIRWTASQFTL